VRNGTPLRRVVLLTGPEGSTPTTRGLGSSLGAGMLQRLNRIHPALDGQLGRWYGYGRVGAMRVQPALFGGGVGVAGACGGAADVRGRERPATKTTQKDHLVP
jgi:hypothetical protein